jgi:hypothetical protein
MARSNVEIIGIEQVYEVLDKLPAKLNKKFLNSSARRSAKGMHQDAVNNISSISGERGGERLANQVKIWLLKSWRAGVWVGWNVKEAKKDYAQAKTRAEKAWAYRGAFWLEYGTASKTTRGGVVLKRAGPGGRLGRGKVLKRAARDTRPVKMAAWFRRAVDGNVENVRRVFMGEVRDTINRFLNRTIKRIGW